MAQVAFSVDELVASLKNTSLPTILVEGRDDMTAYRWIEDRLGIQTANVLPCGGREALLHVYARRNEFRHLKCMFMADRDMWLFDGTYKHHDAIVFTSGYSIENDILDGSHVIDLLSQSEQQTFQQIAAMLSDWFAFEVQEYRAGRAYKVDVHPNKVVPLGGTTVDAAFLRSRGYRKPNKAVAESIERHFTVKFRGKSLLELYARILSAPGRRSKYSRHNLLEIGTKCDYRVHMNRLIAHLSKGLNRAEQMNALCQNGRPFWKSDSDAGRITKGRHR